MTRAHFEGLKAGVMSAMSMLLEKGPLMLSETVFSSPEAMALLTEKFDLLISEAFVFQEPLLAFAHHFGCPSVVLNPVGYTNHLNHYTGSAINPAYVPFFFVPGVNPENFLDRLVNTIMTIGAMSIYHTFYLYKANARMQEVFPGAPPIQQLIKNVSLTLLNNNNALTDPIPLAPSVLEVGGLHIKPGQPLPPSLKQWIENSKDGFVYFSLGSILKSDLLPHEKQDAIFKSFGKLKQRVLVKWDGKVPSSAPKNCRFEKWVPQQAVLAHPNLRVFVSHGGLLSIQESLYFGAAMIAMPVFGDQHMNTAMSTKRGISVKVALSELTTELLEAALIEVIYNPK